MAKSQNSSQMNLSGSSSSLTSEASSKATVSLRSYGIGGTLLQKRILLMTRQSSQESWREREKEEKMQEETEAVQRGLFHSSEQRKGRSRQQSSQGAQADAGLTSLRVRGGSPAPKRKRIDGDHPAVQSDSPYSFPTPFSQSPLMRHTPPESPIRRRLMSPFRILRKRSQSRERPAAVSPHLNSREETAERMSSSPQDETRGQTEQPGARRSVSPNPFLWLCRDRDSRRKTL